MNVCKRYNTQTPTMKNVFSLMLLLLLLVGKQSKSQSLENLTNANNKFSINLYKELIIDELEQDKNLVFSPISISAGLVLAYVGAKDATATQFEKIFGFENTTAFHKKYATFLKGLEANKDAAKITIANAAWLQKETVLLDSYTDVLKNTYQSEAKIVDFNQDATNSEKAINTWVSQQTKGKITELIPLGSTDPLTKLILTNTLYFEALWLEQFKAQFTIEDTFFTPKEEVKMQFMRTNDNFFYTNKETFEVIILPFQDMQYMTIIIPKKGNQLKEVEAQLTPQFYQSLLLQKMNDLLSENTQMKPRKVDLYLPRFKISKNLSLGEKLVNMGLKHAFDVGGTANFSGITPDDNMVIDGVLHNTYLEIDETGAKAASATGVIFLGRDGTKPILLKVNRPFLFFICDGNTGAILFQGRFVTPKED